MQFGIAWLASLELFGLKMAGLGAIGAAIATVASYLAVFLIRAATTKKYVDFKLGTGRLLASCALLSAMAALFILRLPVDYGERFFPYVAENGLTYGIAAALALAVVVINAAPLLRGIKTILKK